MNIRGVIEKYMRKRGFTGLYAPWSDCGCSLKYDLFPCGSSCEDCIPGYVNECGTCAVEGCEHKIEEGADFIVRDVNCWKPEKEGKK